MITIKYNVWGLFVIALFGLNSCYRVDNDALFDDLNKENNFHCWPYDVKVYSFEPQELDSLLYHFPKGELCSEEYELLKWSNEGAVSNMAQDDLSATLLKCDDSQGIEEIKVKEGTMYSGCYREFILKEGEKKKVFEQILILDKDSLKLYSFENINYHL
ncbi:MAG: hypothetical protein ACQERC_13490 [Bacteroidota bacterium]